MNAPLPHRFPVDIRPSFGISIVRDGGAYRIAVDLRNALLGSTTLSGPQVLGIDPATGVTKLYPLAGGGAMQKSANGSDIPDKAAFRSALQLGNAALATIGTTNGTVAAGNDSRFPTQPLGNAAYRSVGSSPGTVAAGDAVAAKADSIGPVFTNTGGAETVTVSPSGVSRTMANGFPEYRSYGLFSSLTTPAGTVSRVDQGANDRGFHVSGQYGYGNTFAPHALIWKEGLDNGTSSANGINTVSLLYLEHQFGSGITGVRETLNIRSIFTGASAPQNANNNYVAIRPNVLAAAPDGGTTGAPRGAFFASNPVCMALSGATGLLEIAGAEVNTGIRTGGEAHFHYGWSVVNVGEKQGNFVDAAYASGSFPGKVPYRNQLLFSDNHGKSPLDPAGAVLRASNSGTGAAMSCDTLMDFSVVSTNYILKAQNTSWSPNALTMNAASMVVNIGGRGSSTTPTINLFSGTGGSAYDARISSLGGNATAGNGILQIDAAAFQVTGQCRPATNGNLPLGTPGNRWSQVYAATGTIDTSDARTKRNLGAPTEALLDAIEAVEIIAYQFLDAVAEKGEDAARVHGGVIAQQVAEALRARDLDPAHYAFWCEDAVTEDAEEVVEVEEDETVEETVFVEQDVIEGDRAVRRKVPQVNRVPVYDMVPLFDEAGAPIMNLARPAQPLVDKDGEPVRDADGAPVMGPSVEPSQAVLSIPRRVIVQRTRTVQRPKIDPATGEAETRLSIRYAELAMLMLAVERRRAARLETRISALESRLA